LKLKDENQARLERIYQQEGGQEFLTNAVGPLLSAIDQAGLASVINRIDLSNEVDTVINRLGFDHGWKGASRMLCQWKSFIQSIHSFEKTPVSFSLRLHALIFHPLDLLKDDGPMACADYYDFHSYENNGKVFSCNRMKKYAESNKKDLILGEFGQSYFTHRYSDELQMSNTKNYLESANSCGFKEAYAWRLSDIRKGFNPEARYSFEAYGATRPAYELIKAENASN
jgi:hypothetical protein